MIYREFEGLKLSALGFGTMRLPVLDGDNAQIDEAAARQMIDYAMSKGINYYDTAWGYHDGHSEAFLGQALKNYPRKSFYLASKFPGYDLSNMDKVKEIFEAQLARCQVKHFDFYLFHNVCERNIDAYLDEEKYGIMPFLMEQRENGRIRRLGFSAHGSLPVMRRFLDAYGDAMEFGQIQLNYLDWDFQDAKAKAELLREYDIPIWVMEPLRGGRLCALAPEHEEKLRALRPNDSVTSWAFRFVQSVPGVTMVLSGMSSMEQLVQNIETFEQDAPLNEAERQALLSIASDMTRAVSAPCTSCRYCTMHCPQGLDIPALISLYNEHVFTRGGFIAPMVIGTIPEDKRPSACLGCGACAAVCPQHIDIPGVMRDFASRLG